LFISKFIPSINFISFAIWSGVRVDNLQLAENPNFLHISKEFVLLIPYTCVKAKNTDLVSGILDSNKYIILKI